MSVRKRKPNGGDEIERKRTRISQDVDNTFSISNMPSTSNAHVDIEQILTHMDMCQKLFFENKINLNNAWTMKIIDYVSRYVCSNTIGLDSLFSRAAISLDVCVKVFGYRVDYVTQETNKLLGLLQSSKETSHHSLQGDTNARPTETRRKNRLRRKSPCKLHIANDTSNLLLNEIPKNTSCYFTGNIDIYSNNSKNMFMNQIPMDHLLHKFHISKSTEPGFLSYNAEDPSLDETLYPVAVPHVQHFTICPEFQSFDIENSDDNNKNTNQQRDAAEAGPSSDNIFDNVVPYDDNGLPVPDLDEPMFDLSADDNNIGDDNEESEIVQQQIRGERLDMITSFCPGKVPVRTAFTEVLLETVWTGPNHWKNKLLRPSAVRYSGQCEEGTTKRKRRSTLKNQQVDLNQIPNINLKNRCKRKLKRPNIESVTLPPRDFSTIPDLDSLTLLNYSSDIIAPECTLDVNYNANDGPIDYENEIIEDNEACNNSEINDGFDIPNSFITPPDMITDTYVPYAKRAKKINMRMLKNILLKSLRGDTCNDNDNKNKDPKKKIKDPEIKENLFSAVYRQLPEKYSQEVNLSTTFFALLYLANEKNLQLDGVKNLNEVKIKAQ